MVSITFFMQLFNKIFDIGTNADKISSKQQIAQTFVEELIAMNLEQFISKIKSDGYTITPETPTANIKFFVCYITAEQLILGQYTELPEGTTLKDIVRLADEYRALALNDVNSIVQQKPITGFVVQARREVIRP